MRNIFILTLSIFIFSCGQVQQAPLKAASNTWVGYESLYIANEFNLLEADVLEVTRYPNATEVMNLFKQKKVDIAALTLDETMMLLDQDVELHIFAVMDISDGADQVVMSSEIGNISDLKGKTIAVEDTALGALMMHAFLAENGLNKADYTLHPSTVDLHAELYKTGEIQAAVTFPPFSDELVKSGAKKVFDSSQMRRAKIVDVLVVSPEAYLNNKPQLEKIAGALVEAGNMLKQNKAAVMAFSGHNLGLPNSEWPMMLDGVLIADKDINVEYLHRYKLESTMLMLDEILVGNGLLKSSIKSKITNELFVKL